RHTRSKRDWSSDVCSSDLKYMMNIVVVRFMSFATFLTYNKFLLSQPGFVSACKILHLVPNVITELQKNYNIKYESLTVCSFQHMYLPPLTVYMGKVYKNH